MWYETFPVIVCLILFSPLSSPVCGQREREQQHGITDAMRFLLLYLSWISWNELDHLLKAMLILVFPFQMVRVCVLFWTYGECELKQTSVWSYIYMDIIITRSVIAVSQKQKKPLFLSFFEFAEVTMMKRMSYGTRKDSRRVRSVTLTPLCSASVCFSSEPVSTTTRTWAVNDVLNFFLNVIFYWKVLILLRNTCLNFVNTLKRKNTKLLFVCSVI